MRKHDVRKWLHAILDLLPVILIPVFMIYSHRHDVTERTDVEVTYKYQSNEVNNPSDLVVGNIYHLSVNTSFDELFYFNGDYGTLELDLINVHSYDFENYGLSMDDWQYAFTGENSIQRKLVISVDYYTLIQFYLTDVDYFVELEFDPNLDSNYFYLDCDFLLVSKENVVFRNSIGNFITQTDYNVIESVEINDTKSSVMNVFMDDFNNSIDKYFNMGNVFNLNGVYQWFNTNIFSGHAPTVIYSIWNIALYELVMDLLFLLYGLFMWFIDMIEKIMDKPFKSIK